jgi:putative heme-binding domain-containing protein
MLVARGNSDVLADLRQLLENSALIDDEQRGQLISALGKSSDPRVAELVLSQYSRLSSDLRPHAIELLTQRPEWSTELLAAIRREEVGKDALNLNQLRRLNSFTDEALRTAVRELYGEIREGRDPGREQVVAELREFLATQSGDPARGEVVFKKLCGQCHKIHGEGAEVGPDITRNGRNNWDQLLWNVLDPSQVIGPGFQARTVVIDDGRTLTGLPLEESDQRIVLKVQGGKTESIPRDQIELYKVSELSMMPDQLEKQLTPQELADLFQFLAHDRHPSDPESRLLPGAPSSVVVEIPR